MTNQRVFKFLSLLTFIMNKMNNIKATKPSTS